MFVWLCCLFVCMCELDCSREMRQSWIQNTLCFDLFPLNDLLTTYPLPRLQNISSAAKLALVLPKKEVELVPAIVPDVEWWDAYVLANRR